MRYYKVTANDGAVIHAGWGAWSCPRLVDGAWRPGKPWSQHCQPIGGALRFCGNGLHICTVEQLRRWLGPKIWVVKPLGDEVKTRKDKCLVRDAQLLYPVSCWNPTDLRAWIQAQLAAPPKGIKRRAVRELEEAIEVLKTAGRSSQFKQESHLEAIDSVDLALIVSPALRTRFNSWITKHSTRPRRREVANG